MAEGATTGAAPAPTNGATNGAGQATQQPAPGVSRPTTTGTGAPSGGAGAVSRGHDGKFVSPGSVTALAARALADGTEPPQQGKADATEPSKEPYRFKRALKVYGKEVPVDLTEDDIAARLQKSYVWEKQASTFKQGTEQAQRLFQLAKEAPELFFQEVGMDPKEWARKALANEAKLASMDERDRAIYERDQKLAEYERREHERTEQEKTAKAEATKAKLVAQYNEQFLPALERGGLPKTYESLYEMVETAKLGLADGIEYTPDELVKETERRLNTYTERYLGGLDGPGLIKKLGPQRIQAILEATVAQFNQSQEIVPQKPAPVVEEEPAPTRRYLSVSEVNENLRNLRNGRG